MTPSGLRWRLWRVARPVVRPLAWRLRTFMVGPLHDDVRALRAQIETLQTELRAQAEREAAAFEPRILSVMEQALLTLALDREARRPPHDGALERGQEVT